MKSCVGVNPCDLVSDLVYNYLVSFDDDCTNVTYYTDLKTKYRKAQGYILKLFWRIIIMVDCHTGSF